MAQPDGVCEVMYDTCSQDFRNLVGGAKHASRGIDVFQRTSQLQANFELYRHTVNYREARITKVL